MIRAVCPDAVSDLKTGFVTGWNVAPNIAYTITVVPGASSCAVWLFDAATGAYLAGGAALVGTDQPVTLLPATTPGLGMVDADLGYHLLITSDGTEPAQTYSIGPFVDSADQISAIYTVDDIAVAYAAAVIRAGTHYTDDVSIMCPLGFSGWLGDVVSATVHGETVAGDIEAIAFHATPSSMSDVITLRRMSAILPDAPVVIVPPNVADDTAETDASTAVTGYVLTNDSSGLTVVAVDGIAANVGVAVSGSNGGVFTIAADGAWTFDPDGYFAALSGSDTAETSVTYHASNGLAEGMATLTVTVRSAGIEIDPHWNHVSFLLNADNPPIVGNGSWTDVAQKSTITPYGTPQTAILDGIHHIAFKGNPDRLHIDSADSFAFGSNDFTIEQVWVPTVDHSGAAKWAFCTMYGAGYSVSTIPQWMLCGSIQGNHVSFGWYLSSTALDYLVVPTAGVLSGVPICVCVERRSGMLSMYIDGRLRGQRACARVFPYTSQGLRINYASVADGSTWGAFWQRGHLRSFRVTKEVCRYDSDYVVDSNRPYFPVA